MSLTLYYTTSIKISQERTMPRLLPLLALCLCIAGAAAAAPSMPPPFTRQLQAGDSGGDVKILQYLLRLKAISGSFDALTQSTLQAFQKNGAG